MPEALPSKNVPNSMNVNHSGGIDLNPSQINMTTNSHGPAIEFNLDPAMLARLQNASGVSPVIMGVKPLASLSEFLGLSVILGK